VDDFIINKKTLLAFPQMITGLIFYFSHILLRVFVHSYNFTLIRFHIANFLALIVCVPLFANLQIFLKIRRKNYISVLEILLYFILFSLFFEFIFPLFFENVTGDLFDIIFYAIGGLTLYLSQRKIKKTV